MKSCASRSRLHPCVRKILFTGRDEAAPTCIPMRSPKCALSLTHSPEKFCTVFCSSSGSVSMVDPEASKTEFRTTLQNRPRLLYRCVGPLGACANQCACPRVPEEFLPANAQPCLSSKIPKFPRSHRIPRFPPLRAKPFALCASAVLLIKPKTDVLWKRTRSRPPKTTFTFALSVSLSPFEACVHLPANPPPTPYSHSPGSTFPWNLEAFSPWGGGRGRLRGLGMTDDRMTKKQDSVDGRRGPGLQWRRISGKRNRTDSKQKCSSMCTLFGTRVFLDVSDASREKKLRRRMEHGKLVGTIHNTSA